MIPKIIYIVIFCINILNAYKIDNNNSIYNVSKNARINSLGTLHLSSNNINGLFVQPLNFSKNIKGDSYYSYIKSFDNLISVYQFGVCLNENKNNNISFGVIKRSIDNINNTTNAWQFTENGPEFNQIDYTQISEIQDNEIGLLISYGYKISSFSSISIKIKPSFHKIFNKEAHGLGLDMIFVQKIKKMEFVFGCEDIISYKKWNTGAIEEYNINPYINFTLNFHNFLLSIETNTMSELKYGFEYKISPIFILRCGLNEFNKISYGAGISTDVVNFNFAYFKTEFSFSDYVTQYSLIIKFDGLKKIYQDLKI